VDNVGDLGGGLTSVEHSAERAAPLDERAEHEKPRSGCQIPEIDLVHFCPEKSQKNMKLVV
jgi:hypothetical protein